MNKNVICRPLLGETVMELSHGDAVILTAFQEKEKAIFAVQNHLGLIPN